MRSNPGHQKQHRGRIINTRSWVREFKSGPAAAGSGKGSLSKMQLTPVRSKRFERRPSFRCFPTRRSAEAPLRRSSPVPPVVDVIKRFYRRSRKISGSVCPWQDFQPSLVAEDNVSRGIVRRDWVFAWGAMTYWHKSQRHQFICKHKLLRSSLTHLNLFWRWSNKMMHLVVGWVMEGSMAFCQKNILEQSMSFHGDYIKRCLLTHRVSQIL